ncbi:MAG: acetamidase [Clostridiales bacterium]|nr:acetamidase [Clostridiales bacterium]
MLILTKATKTDILDTKNAPAAVCESGDTVLFETEDCYDDSVTREGERKQIKRLYNPATGPLFVNGAEKGDTLKVEILSIELNDWGAMGTYFGEGAFTHLTAKNTMHVFDLTKGTVNVGGHELALDPMIGVIGVAPEGEGVLTVTPGSHGGNMDCSRVRAGSTLYFPVACDGALLSMGDLHAVMGDGEVFGYGLEAKGKVTVKVTVIKDHPVTCPIILDGNEVSTVGSGKTMEDATNECLAAMHSLLMKNGLNETEAGLMLSLKCNLISCQIVNPLFTMRAELPAKFFKLP